MQPTAQQDIRGPLPEGLARAIRETAGDIATLSTGGGHFWPYGLNYENEFSNTAADRHVQIVAAMVRDGL